MSTPWAQVSMRRAVAHEPMLISWLNHGTRDPGSAPVNALMSSARPEVNQDNSSEPRHER